MSMGEEALQLTPDGHADRAIQLGSLGYSLWARYWRFGDAVDLKKLTSMTEQAAVELTPDGHPNKPLWLNYLGHLSSTRYKHLRDAVDLE